MVNELSINTRKHKQDKIQERSSMKKQKKRVLITSIILVLAITLLSINCGDEDESNNDTGSGNWIPLTNGSTWTYKGDFTNELGMQVFVVEKIVIVGDTTVSGDGTYKSIIDSITYTLKSSFIDSTWTEVTREYLGKTSTFYKSGIPRMGAVTWYDILKIPAKVGDTWQPDPADTTSYAKTEAFEDVKIDSLNKTFTNCVKVKSYELDEQSLDYKTQYAWFADGVGLIKSTVESPTASFTIQLTSYTIK